MEFAESMDFMAPNVRFHNARFYYSDPLCCQILLSIRAQMSTNTIADDSSAMSSNVVYILYFIAYGNDPIVVGREMGVDSKKNYVPAPIGSTTFSYLPGQKLIGLGRSLIAVDPSEIVKKCVIATSNEISGMYVVTALVNSFETD